MWLQLHKQTHGAMNWEEFKQGVHGSPEPRHPDALPLLDNSKVKQALAPLHTPLASPVKCTIARRSQRKERQGSFVSATMKDILPAINANAYLSLKLVGLRMKTMMEKGH
ncbi:hypothetical protein Patl1_22989 [Pistacia atlantica]|uniref:Uncharacterized protein n=1 Tax=Pistacia atlantica TaxID=434234 RepID=A0ACC1A1W5_9ROSI|nr:hypothetical protein Patl1_22989 [Pistacia atlantica]